MDQMHFILGKILRDDNEAILNAWTMKLADTESARERRKKENPQNWASSVMNGELREFFGSEVSSERDRQYLEQGCIERMRRSFDRSRGEGIEEYMRRVRFEDEQTRRNDGTPAGEGNEKPSDDEESDCSADLASEDIETSFIEERRCMEILLVCEAELWEVKLWNISQAIAVSDNVLGKRLTTEWEGNCWKRLYANIEEMEARMDAAKAEATTDNLRNASERCSNEIREAWQTVVKRLCESPTPELVSTSNFEDLIDNIERHRRLNRRQRSRFHGHCEDIKRRLYRKLEDFEVWFNPVQLSFGLGDAF
jgi:hypothetical protein